MMGPSQYAGITQSAIGAGQLIGGIIKSRKAKEDYRKLGEGPEYRESEAYKYGAGTVSLAERLANQGMPEESMRFREDMVGRNTSALLSSTSGLRSGIAGVGGVASIASDQYRQIAADDAMMRRRSQKDFIDQRNMYQDEMRYDFENEVGQFVNKRAEILGRMAAGQQQQNEGINTWSEGISTFGGSGGGGISGMI